MHPGVQSATLDTSGAGTCTIAHNLANLFWRIHQISVSIGGAVVTTQVSFNGLPLTSTTTGATPLTASRPPPIDIGGHDTLTVTITQGPPSAVAVVTYYYDEIQGVPA